MTLAAPVTPSSEGRVTLHTVDGERLRARLLPGPDGTDTCVVVAHGFGMALDRRDVLAASEALAESAAVLAYDARGHGLATGASSLGVCEVLDVDAAVAAARDAGYERVVTLGFSMGGSAVIRHAGLLGGAPPDRGLDLPLSSPPDAVVSVSAPARWYARDTRPLRRLTWAVAHRSGRLALRALSGARVDEWRRDAELTHPVEAVGCVAPRPLLLVHGDADDWFGVEHARELFLAARAPVALWLEPGMGHAEAGGSAALWYRLGDALPDLLAGRLTGAAA